MSLHSDVHHNTSAMGIYLGLGSNVGDREAQLRFAVSALQGKDIVCVEERFALLDGATGT